MIEASATIATQAHRGATPKWVRNHKHYSHSARLPCTSSVPAMVAPMGDLQEGGPKPNGRKTKKRSQDQHECAKHKNWWNATFLDGGVGAHGTAPHP